MKGVEKLKVITIAARKGGDGKTTTAHTIGAGLQLRGYKVLYVDLDTQRNLTRRLGQIDTDKNAYHALTAITAEEVLRSVTPINESCGLLAGTIAYANYERDNAGYKGAFECVRMILEPFKGRYDFAIIDTPAQFGLLTVAALFASDKVIIPMQATADSLQGVQTLYEIIEQAQDTNKRLEVCGILPTRYRARVITKQMLDVAKKWAELVGLKVYSPIRECVAIQEAELLKQDIFTYSKKSNAAKDYELFIDELLRG